MRENSAASQDAPVQPHVAVVGGASLDVLRFRGEVARSAGGAGLYTALAAARLGCRVTMVGPRPEPMPPELRLASRRLDWHGPAISPSELPHFDIAHLGEGRRELRAAQTRAEARLSPAHLPPDLPPGPVFCISFGDSSRQLEFARHLKGLGRTVACGTWPRAEQQNRDAARAVAEVADLHFCDEADTSELFGGLERARADSGRLRFVHRRSGGVRVLQGAHATDIDPVAADELDPTGARDAFAGTVLAAVTAGGHPVEAARQGMAAAAEMVTRPGPEALLAPPPPPTHPLDPRAIVDSEAIARLSVPIGELRGSAPFDFLGPGLPARDHPRALDYFFSATLHQFGFWLDDGERFLRPMNGVLAGRRLKGSDYLWSAFGRWLERDPDGLTPASQARLSALALERHLGNDGGRVPLPTPEANLALAVGYGRDMETLGWSPADLVVRANASPRPTAALLASLDHVSGYREDPLRKKSALLALILRNRPERFLRAVPGDDVPPIVDYHVQRSCLRMGLVEMCDSRLREAVASRLLLPPEDEAAVRRACHAAVLELARASDVPMAILDRFLFENRARCPEMTQPDCASCPVESACAQRTELFQPVRRTTAY